MSLPLFPIIGGESKSRRREKYAGPTSRYVNLLVIQASPFCNIDCTYCYLPTRKSTARLDRRLLLKLLRELYDADLVDKRISIVWHAGEPLATPLSFYRGLFDDIRSLNLPALPSHAIQTNGTLLNQEWCKFIQENEIKIGVSLDGPEFLHDLHRKDRLGKGTFKRVMQGVSHLRSFDIHFHTIAVVSAASLDHADEIYDFFVSNEIRDVGFNIEELEGAHVASTFTESFTLDRVRAFFARLLERQLRSNGALRIREFDRSYEVIARNNVRQGRGLDNSDLTSPFGILSMDCEGNLSTFSPELLGMQHDRYGSFSFGNIADTHVREILEHPRFLRVAQEIQDGVEACARSCEYFFLCGGGAPSNKLYENGTFNSTETTYCKSIVQTPIDVVLADLERSLECEPTYAHQFQNHQ
jgi:uncharacterized protein